jgi:HK97 family phage major capsid protein
MELENLANELKTKLESKAEINDMLKKADKTQIEEINASLTAISDKLKTLDNSAVSKITKKQLITEAIKSVKETLQSNRANGFVEVKSVGTMTFAGSITGEIPAYDRLPGINMLPRNRHNVLQFSNVGFTDSNVVAWVEEVAGEGTVSYTTEGQKKNQQDYDWKENTLGLKKITVFSKISEEMLQDISWMQSELEGRMSYNLMDKVEAELILGGGTAALNGVTFYAQPLDNAGLAGSVPTEANYWDCMYAAIQQINAEAKAQANLIMLNPIDIFKLYTASKDANAAYTVAPFVSADGMAIAGVPIVANDNIPSGNFLVGDFTRFNVRFKTGVQELTKIGYESDDFVKNLVTLIKESRLVSFVKANDVHAFVYEAFADAQTFLKA